MRPAPVLKRFEAIVYSTVSGGGLIPAAASIQFLEQGATPAGDYYFQPQEESDMFVFDTGCILQGMYVYPDGDVTLPLEVKVADSVQNKLRLFNPSATDAIPLGTNTRLMILGALIDVYRDPMGQVPLVPFGHAVDTDPSTGRVSCYLRSLRFDYVVTVGLESHVFIDSEAGWLMR